MDLHDLHESRTYHFTVPYAIVENMAGLISQIAPKAHCSYCAQGSSVKLRPGLINQTAPSWLIGQTEPMAHPPICARAHPPNCARAQVGASGSKIYLTYKYKTKIMSINKYMYVQV